MREDGFKSGPIWQGQIKRNGEEDEAHSQDTYQLFFLTSRSQDVDPPRISIIKHTHRECSLVGISKRCGTRPAED